MSQSKELIQVAVAKLKTESQNYYKSGNEALYTSIVHTMTIVLLLILLGFLGVFKELKESIISSLLGVGGGGTSVITIGWGFSQRWERREKARHLEEQRESLEKMAEISDLDSDETKQIINSTLELTVRTILAPYEFTREKTEGTN